MELICHSFLGLQLFPRWAAPQRILQREELEPFALVSMGIIGLEAGHAAKDHPHDESNGFLWLAARLGFLQPNSNRQAIIEGEEAFVHLDWMDAIFAGLRALPLWN